MALIVRLCMGVMAGLKGHPYVHDTYGWPKGPAIIPRDSYLGRRPSLFFLASTTICLTISLTGTSLDFQCIHGNAIFSHENRFLACICSFPPIVCWFRYYWPRTISSLLDQSLIMRPLYMEIKGITCRW